MLCLNRLWMASSSSVERFFHMIICCCSSIELEETTKYDIYEMIQYDLICICWCFEHRSRMGRCKSSSTQVGNVKTLILSVLQTAEFEQLKSSLRTFSRNTTSNISHLGAHITAHLLSFCSLFERGKKEIVEEKLKQLLFFNFVNGYRSFSHSWKLRMCYFIYGNFQTQAE